MTKYTTKLPGRIYKKRNKRPDGTTIDHSTWTVRHKGRDYSTGESDPKKAEQFLLALIAGRDVSTPAPRAWATALPAAESAKSKGALMSEVLDLFIADSERRKLASAPGNRGIVENHLRPFFGEIPAVELTTSLFDRYRDQRLESSKEPTPATVNREMAALKRALNYSMKEHEPPLVLRYPKITMLKESDPREGFLSFPDYMRLKSALPDYMVPLLITGFHVGRRRQELLDIDHRDIELDAPMPHFRVYADTAKNGTGSVVPVYGEMFPALRQQILMTKRDFPGCTLLFHKNGRPIQKNEAFYSAWEDACKLVGLEGLLFHDLRRAACRMLIRAGNSRKEAMRITGHRTESAFERYNIVDEEDMKRATSNVSAYLEKELAALPTSELIS